MRPIVAGFDAQSLTGKFQTGLGTYAFHLVRQLERHPETIDLRLIWPKERKPFSRTMERLMWEQYYLVMAAIKEDVDLIHSPCFSVPKFTKIPRVVTAHDLIVLKNPKLMPAGSRWYFGSWIPQSYKSADHIIAVSHATKDDLVEILGIQSDKITVIHHGINPSFTRTTDPHEINRIRFKYHCPDEYFIMVGSFEERKNIEVAVKAFAEMANASPRMKLLLVGKDDPYRRKIMELVRSLRLEESVLFPGFVPERELATLYSMATAFLFPSSAEGFGLPIAEAMATGAPVIASDLKVFHEVASDAVVYVPVGDAKPMKEAMMMMLEDSKWRADYVRKGLARSLRYNWEHAAEETVKVYYKVLARHHVDLTEKR